MGFDVQYYTEKQKVKRVYYTGTDILRGGYALCYDRDTITAAARGPGFHQGATELAAEADLTAGYESWGRHAWAEKPSATNLEHFAGLVAVDQTKAGPYWIDIIEPESCNRVTLGWTEENCTIDVTMLTVKAGSYALGGIADGGPIVGKAVQTIDRSSTNALVQMILLSIDKADLTAESFTASGRAVTALPTNAIWRNFPIAAMRANPFLGSLLELDFRRGEAVPPSFVDATYAATALGKSQIEGIYPGITAVGELIFFTTEDNGAAELQWPCPIDLDGGNEWAFECRIKCVNITTEKGSWFVGLNTAKNMDGGLQADAGATPLAASYLGFNTDAAATSALDTLYLLTGQSQNTHAAAIHTLVADTYVTLGLYYNGTDIAQYVNGVAAGTDILGTGDMDQADFPLAAILVPSVAVKGAHADDYTATLDWLRVAQAP